MGMFGPCVLSYPNAGKLSENVLETTRDDITASSSLPSSYVDALNIFLQYKANQLQAGSFQQSTQSTSAEAQDSSSRQVHIHRLTAQRRFADILASQIIAQRASGTNADHDGSGPTYTVTLPRNKYLNDGKAVKRQGPFLFKPAPEELKLSAETGTKVEGVASDIIVLPGISAQSSLSTKGKAKEQSLSGSGVGVVAISWKDGRVDVCLEVAKVEAIWEDEVVSHRKEVLCVAMLNIACPFLARVRYAKLCGLRIHRFGSPARIEDRTRPFRVH